MTKVNKLILAMCLLVAPGAAAFSLLGPPAPWQVNALTYQWPGADIGSPMNLGEGFRWNIPVITYAFDREFLKYFGPEGVNAIDEAVRILNDLDAPAKISDDLSEYSTETLRENFEAQTLGIVDLKSTALHILVEEMGLADAIRFVFTLRGRETRTLGGVTITNYTTVMRNYDPVALIPTPYVNGVRYTYDIEEFAFPFQHADAVEFVRFSPDGLANVPVSTGFSMANSTGPSVSFASGVFRTGLTRDDVGGLKYLYHPRNYAVESLLPTVIAGTRLGNSSAWIPFLGITNTIGVTNVIIGTNGLGTNILSTGVRGGRKPRFQRVFFDELLGQAFTPLSNAYPDVVVSTNGVLVVQPVLRLIGQPDLVFSASDLGLVRNIDPVVYERTTTASWIDNDALNGVDEVGQNARGPGVIPPQVIISFTTQLPFFFNSTASAFLGDFPSEDTGFTFGVWGSFDGSTNPPVIYPRAGNISVQQLRNTILRGGNSL